MDIDIMAWVSAPELTVRPMRQGYTRLADRLYLFENLDGTGFRAELPVDEDDVVLDYQGVFRRSTDGARREPGSGEDWQRVGLHIDGLVDAFLAQALGLVQDGDAALAESGRCAKGPRLQWLLCHLRS